MKTNPHTNLPRGQMLGNMIVLATNAHAGQVDRGGRPYIMHTLSVLNLLNSDDEELNCIAVGHDVIEDTKATWADLRAAQQSERVIEGIRCMTKMLGETYEEYQAKVLSNVDAMRVKLRDLRHNSDIQRLKGVSEKDIARIAKYHVFYVMIEAELARLGLAQ